MTFEEFWKRHARFGSLKIAEMAWQAAQASERERSKELVETLEEIALCNSWEAGLARAAIEKYNETENQ